MVLMKLPTVQCNSVILILPESHTLSHLPSYLKLRCESIISQIFWIFIWGPYYPIDCNKYSCYWKFSFPPTQKLLFLNGFHFPLNDGRSYKKTNASWSSWSKCLFDLRSHHLSVMTLLQLRARARSRYWTGSMRIFSARIGLPSTPSSVPPRWKSEMLAKVTPAFTGKMGKCCFYVSSLANNAHSPTYIVQFSVLSIIF